MPPVTSMPPPARPLLARLQAHPFVRRYGLGASTIFVALVAFWLLVLVLLPYGTMVLASLHPNLPPDQMGGPNDHLTLEQYESFVVDPFGFGTNWIHIVALLKTIGTSALVTLIDLMVAYPLAYFMAKVAAPGQLRLITIALLVPFWLNEVLRVFALRVILASGGIINQVLTGIGLIDSPVDFLGSNAGIYIGLVYAYFLMMVFPLYSAIESLDRNQIDAARDMGSTWVGVHRDVVLPHARPGVAAGCTMVFMAAVGSLLVPQVLGGPSTLWFTSLVYNFFFQSFDWARGAAYGFIFVVVCLAFVLIMLKLFRVKLGEVIK